MQSNTETAILGGGCFWCVEAVFQKLRGVVSVVSGYAGGSTDEPTYRDICTGATGHAEVIQVEFEPEKISFDDILTVFFHTHDPTTLNRQGNDVGTQYRSVIFYTNPDQERIARDKIKELDAGGIFADPIVTEVSPAPKFYPAEDYHQNFFQRNPAQPYCL
ncbi:MAG: peptide-methionine (S)-S-oxide reductase MsrA, partial [Leptospiraceae bacterium]|nr:peptide-methionine (S)-S-oxide reductase MsrA [Leptospiraceae bacterium]